MRTQEMKSTSTVWALAMLLTACLLPPLCGQEVSKAQLDRVRDAVGHAALRSWEHGVVIEGHGKRLGLETDYRLTLLSDGRFKIEYLSDLSTVEGYDGRRGWKVDFCGMPGHLELRDLEESQLFAWVLGGCWLDPECPLEIDASSEKCFTLKVPGGQMRAELEISREDSLPKALSWTRRGTPNKIVLGDYRQVARFRFPHKIRVLEEEEISSIEIDTVAPAGSTAAAGCRPIDERPADTRFEQAHGQPLEVKKTFTGHILMKPLIDGEEGGWFFLDTGAGMNAINTGLAEKLGMDQVGRIKAVGAGGAVESRFRRGRSIAIGGVTIDDPLFVDVDLSFIEPIFNCKIGGALGYDFLCRCLVEYDGADERIVLHEPGSWNEREAPWREIVFDGNIPTVRCRLEGDREGLFTLDTGSNETVSFHQGFVKKHALLKDRKVGKGQAGGVGGYVNTYVGELEWFELGDHRFEKPKVSFTEGSEEGAFVDEVTAGNIGGGFLSSFTMLIDYPNKRIAFVLKEPADDRPGD